MIFYDEQTKIERQTSRQGNKPPSGTSERTQHRTHTRADEKTHEQKIGAQFIPSIVTVSLVTESLTNLSVKGSLMPVAAASHGSCQSGFSSKISHQSFNGVSIILAMPKPIYIKPLKLKPKPNPKPTSLISEIFMEI